MSGLEFGKCYIIQHYGKGFPPEDIGKPVKYLGRGAYTHMLGAVEGFDYKMSGFKEEPIVSEGYWILASFGDSPVEYHDLNEPKYCVVLAEKGCMMKTRNDFINTTLTKNMIDTYDSEGYTVINYFEIGER